MELGAESAMLSTATANGFTRPEVPIDEQRFPLRQLQRALLCCAPQPPQQQQQLQQRNGSTKLAAAGKFPLLLHGKCSYARQRFPVQQQQAGNTRLQSTTAIEKFPEQMIHLPMPQRFPLLCQLPKRNLNYSMQSISGWESRLPVATSRSAMLTEFPTIKKQFVSFPDNQPSCKRQLTAGHGNGATTTTTGRRTDVVPTPTTVTQTSHNLSTKIDMDSQRTVDAVSHDNDDDDDDVHKAAFDNELNAREQTLNLNVEAEGVGERKEIEHQQAENVNDAFGWRHDGNEGDAMNAAAAKNKREICEQSKLETTAAHNELNMTKERQSICLATEQSQTIAEPNASNRKQRQSDARESSPEQVDASQERQRQRQQISINVTQAENSAAARQTSLEYLKSAVRALLDESGNKFPLLDLDLIDLLVELVQLIATPKSTSTGNFWSEPVAVDCDMTVTKVSDESEATAVVVDIYSEQLEQPVELDESNSSSSSNNQSGDMKYEELKSTSRLPETLPSRLSSTATTAAAALATTSRIRDVAVPTATTSRPLLGELKRSSTSRDDVSIDVDSLLPERTRLRRQRRMRSQESVEEKPEDVIERLNKLKARISGALSEVKGVLKQYSTESEAEAAGEKWLGPPAAATTTTPAVETEPVQPVQFRFVKKVRRRSYFDEAEEETERQQEQEDKEATIKETKELKKEVVPVNEEQEKLIETLSSNEEEQKAKEQQENTVVNGELQPKATEKTKAQVKLEFLAKVQSELKSKPKEKEAAATAAQKVDTAATTNEAAGAATAAEEQPEKEVAVKKEAAIKEETDTAATAGKEQPKETDTAATAAREPSQEAVTTATATTATATAIEEKIVTPATRAVKTQQQQQPVEGVEATALAAALPDESATQPANLDVSATKTTTTKKKTIVKLRNPRRASIAAVEPSKIKAEVGQIDALTQRRPSDSEAIVKRTKKPKLTLPTTSGSSQRAAATKPQQATATTGEQLATAKVNNNAATAKSVTKPTAKSAEVDAKQQAETATAAATAATLQAAPKELPIIDRLANQATASEQSRRASLKLAELVGETVLVVPAAATTTTTTAAATTAVSSSLLSQSKEPINQPLISPASATETHQQVVVDDVDIEVAPVDADADVVVVAATPQIAATLSEVSHEKSSPQQQQQQQQQIVATKDNAQAQPNNSLAAMPELKVLTGPVQPVKIETVERPHDESDLVVVKKKSSHLKKLVRKSSIDKGKEKVASEASALSNILKDKNKIGDLGGRLVKQTPPKKQAKQVTKEPAPEQQQQQENAPGVPAEITSETKLELELEQEPEPAAAGQPEVAPVPKKPRQIKKKVIIKRQKRRLSIGDTFFIQQEPEEPKVPEIETIEKAIAYVTDDEADVEPEPEPEPPKPLKSCLHVREYKIGDLVLYAERYRKTQVRWKRGRVLERITSISYKLEIEGKEVPAHISYIKKYTGRKVKFVGKEYLEIDYEQVVEEERRARSYSIWNMV